MKTRITTLLLALVTSMSFGQLTFVKDLGVTVDINWSFSDEKDDGNFTELDKYVFYKTDLTINILKGDLSSYKTVSIDTTNGYAKGYNRFNVVMTDHLFNLDDKIEFIIEAKYIDFNDNWTTKKTTVFFVDEDNNLLQELKDKSLDIGENVGTVNGITYAQIGSELYTFAGHYPCNSCNSSSASSNSRVQAPAPTYSFSLFPNPTDGQLNITTDLDESNMQIKIYSTSGQLLQTDAFFTGTNSVNVSSLAAGTYVINITSDKGFLHTEQFVKK